MPLSDIDWDAAQIARLRTFWDEGHSAAEIGRRMGTTKNAIIGKARRLELPSRPSPIVFHPWNDDDRATVRRLWGTLSARNIGRRIKRREGEVRAEGKRMGLVMLPTAPVKPVAPVRPVFAVKPMFAAPVSVPRLPAQPVRIGTEPCCWPVAGRLSCDAPVVPRKPYCEAHCAIAYVPGSALRRSSVISPENAGQGT